MDEFPLLDHLNKQIETFAGVPTELVCGFGTMRALLNEQERARGGDGRLLFRWEAVIFASPMRWIADRMVPDGVMLLK